MLHTYLYKPLSTFAKSTVMPCLLAYRPVPSGHCNSSKMLLPAWSTWPTCRNSDMTLHIWTHFTGSLVATCIQLKSLKLAYRTVNGTALFYLQAMQSNQTSCFRSSRQQAVPPRRAPGSFSWLRLASTLIPWWQNDLPPLQSIRMADSWANNV